MPFLRVRPLICGTVRQRREARLVTPYAFGKMFLMKRPLIAVSLFGLMVGLSLSLSSPLVGATQKKGKNPKAFDLRVDNWGKPKEWDGKKDDINSFWVWYDDGIWHFRTTGGGKGAHHFQGKIEVAGGAFLDMKGQKGEFGGGLVDRYVYNADRTAMAFDFRTNEGVDGVNFKVAPATAVLKFTLSYDGKSDPLHIRLGRQSDRPAAATFAVPARPNDDDGPSKKGKK